MKEKGEENGGKKKGAREPREVKKWTGLEREGTIALAEGGREGSGGGK